MTKNSDLFIEKNEEKKVIIHLENSVKRWYSWDDTGLLNQEYQKEVKDYIKNFYNVNFNKYLNK